MNNRIFYFNRNRNGLRFIYRRRKIDPKSWKILTKSTMIWHISFSWFGLKLSTFNQWDCSLVVLISEKKMVATTRKKNDRKCVSPSILKLNAHTISAKFHFLAHKGRARHEYHQSLTAIFFIKTLPK